ncbi:MAG: hypothetical protein MJZ71_02075 [Bacteroidales bacterium]|nr:hypothetical protein [Bacteroidales bacterium]
MKRKLKHISIAFVLVLLLASCSSNKTMMKKHRRGKCNCPTWSQNIQNDRGTTIDSNEAILSA